VMIVN